MAVGAITATGSSGAFIIELLASVTAANNAPSGSSAGLAVDTVRARYGGSLPSMSGFLVGVKDTAGSGTMTVTLRLWSYSGAIWFASQPFNVSSAAPHTAVAIPETGSDDIGYAEWVKFDLRTAERLYLEVTAIAGTSTAVTGYLICPSAI